MMPNLNEIYDSSFFDEWGINNEKYIKTAQNISEILYTHFLPKSLVDVGCGCGVYSDFFLKKGVQVTAIDGVLPPKNTSYPISIHQQDITTPFKSSEAPFDTVLCLEVAEHIPEEYVDVFLDNLTGLGDMLILSAAPPNQGGHHHVNERPKRYWVQKLLEKDFIYDRRKTGKLQEIFKKEKPGFMWMCEHISIYHKKRPGDKPPAELAFGVKTKGL